MKKIFSTIIATVLIEIAIFIIVGKLIGVVNTLFLIIFTSFIGIVIAKKQGIQSVQKIRSNIERRVAPGVALIDTFLIFIGGVLLVFPGFISDLIGFLLLIPFTRKLFKPMVYFWLRKKMKNGQVTIIHR